MKKLLLITAISPFPQDNGGATRIRNTIKELSNKFDLYLISTKNENYILNNEEVKDINTWCKKSIFIPLSNDKKFGSYLDIGQPYWFSNWYLPELITAINSLIADCQIDIIQIEFSQFLYLIDYLPKKYQKKCIFTSHDISTISFFRRLSEVKSIRHKIVHFFRFIEVYLYEKKYIPKYSLINAVSQNDNFLLKKYFKPKKVITVANGIEKINFLKPKNISNKKIVLGYIGSFSHPPNKTAFLYFINRIAPKLEENKIDYQYILAGKNNPNELEEILSKISTTIKSKIVNMGFVDSPKHFFEQIDVLITPISAGSGSRIKILEALGYGKKIISSKVGAEGINLKTNLISIANNPNEYIQEINNFILNRKNINFSEEAKNISKLTWKYIFKDYQKTILR